MPRVSFNEDECKGCGLCISACPKKILVFYKGKINKKGYSPVTCTEPDKCIGCAMCATMCPDVVIKVEK
ncbi:MAG: 4Fe-4S dicluster domain-containing protein [Clostridiales bacterium]|nr:4Fe-4S dicluster domain-containing protein [Clostridiales bacterium]